jgi:hypothetical protein
MATGPFRESSDWHCENFVRSVELGPADITALVSNPVQLVPAPGPSQMVYCRRFIVSWKAGDNDYVAPDAGFLSVGHGSEGDAVADLTATRSVTNDAASVLLAGADKVRVFTDLELKLPPSDFAGKAVAVYLDGTVDPTDGDGSLVVTADYALVTV